MKNNNTNITPITVQLEITDICNMRCPMCITSDQCNQKHTPKMTTQFIISNILQPLQKLGVQYLSLSGGEPTLAPNMLTVIREARELGVKIFLATNALSEKLFSYEDIFQEIETGNSAIQISYDSMYSHEFDEIRGGHYYDTVTSNIKRMVKILEAGDYTTSLAASVVVQERNAASFVDTVKFIQSELGIKRVIVQLRHDYNNVTENNWRNQKILKLSSEARDLILENGEKLFELAQKDSHITPMGRSLDNWKAFLSKPISITQKCGAGKRIFVDPYGNLRGCIHSPIIANLHDTSIESYLCSKQYKNFLSFADYCNICIHGCAS